MLKVLGKSEQLQLSAKVCLGAWRRATLAIRVANVGTSTPLVCSEIVGLGCGHYAHLRTASCSDRFLWGGIAFAATLRGVRVLSSSAVGALSFVRRQRAASGRLDLRPRFDLGPTLRYGWVWGWQIRGSSEFIHGRSAVRSDDLPECHAVYTWALSLDASACWNSVIPKFRGVVTSSVSTSPFHMTTQSSMCRRVCATNRQRRHLMLSLAASTCKRITRFRSSAALPHATNDVHRCSRGARKV